MKVVNVKIMAATGGSKKKLTDFVPVIEAKKELARNKGNADLMETVEEIMEESGPTGLTVTDGILSLPASSVKSEGQKEIWFHDGEGVRSEKTSVYEYNGILLIKESAAAEMA